MTHVNRLEFGFKSLANEAGQGYIVFHSQDAHAILSLKNDEFILKEITYSAQGKATTRKAQPFNNETRKPSRGCRTREAIHMIAGIAGG